MIKKNIEGKKIDRNEINIHKVDRLNRSRGGIVAVILGG